MDVTTKTGSGGAALGYVLAVVQAVMYSSMGIFSKLMYASGLGPSQVVVLRFAAATVLLGAFLLLWRKQPLISRQPAVYLQSVFFFVCAILYFWAIERLNAGMTTAIFYSYPVAVAVGNTIFFKERFAVSTFIALVLTIGGLILISGVVAGGIVLDALGIAFGVGSCLCFAGYTLLIQKTGRVEGPLTVTFTLSLVSLALGCVVFAPAVPTLANITPYQIGLACGLALLCTIVPIGIYIEAVKRIGGTKASLIGVSETPSTLLLAFIILGETVTLQQGIGACLIIVGILVVSVAPILKASRGQKKAAPKSDRMR